MNRLNLYFIVLILILFPVRIVAQTDFVAGSSSASLSEGYISISIGQAACIYSSNSWYYDGQGLQQPYCTPSFDTTRVSICLNAGYLDSEFMIPSDSTTTIGMMLVSHRYRNIIGCDSIKTIELTVLPSPMSELNMVVCDSILWQDSIYYVSGIYNHFDTTVLGCDSITTLNLTVNHSTASNTSAQAYLQYQWQGQSLNTSGHYSDTIHNANTLQCDSIIHLSLSVITDAAIPVIYCYSRQIILVDHYPWGEDSTRVDYRAYRWYHDNELMPLAVNDKLFDRSGRTYHNLEGCYYVEVPVDDARQFWVRSNEICLVGESADLRGPSLSVSPNPSLSSIPIHVDIQNAPIGCILNIHDQNGRPICTYQVDDSIISLHLPSGIYSITLRMPDGSMITKKQLVR